MKQVIFIHGYTSFPKKKKWRLIAEDLEQENIPFSIPELPGGEYPYSKDWLEIIDREVKMSDYPVVLVGHSLGTRAALLYLDKFERKVDTVILIASFNNDYKLNGSRRDEHYADFFEYALDLEKIKKLANKFVVMHSKDDPDIPYSQGEEIAKGLGAKLITYENMGHFSGEERAQKNAREYLKAVKSVLN